jgi:AhpD family alkylhydroperoxidase
MTKRLDYYRIAPNGAKALSGLYGHVMQSCLLSDPDLAHFRVSQNNCAYCLNMHTRDLIEKGIEVDKVALLRARISGGNLFKVVERAVLAMAKSLTRAVGTGLPGRA